MHKYCYRDRSWLPYQLRRKFRKGEITLSCAGDHQPAEAMERHYPGCAENIDCLQVTVMIAGNDKGLDREVIITDDLSEDQIEEIIEEMLEDLH